MPEIIPTKEFYEDAEKIWRNHAIEVLNITDETISNEDLELRYGSYLLVKFDKNRLHKLPKRMQKYVDYILAHPEEFEDIEPANPELSV